MECIQHEERRIVWRAYDYRGYTSFTDAVRNIATTARKFTIKPRAFVAKNSYMGNKILFNNTLGPHC